MSNAFPVKVTAPEKRLKLDKGADFDSAMPPPPPKKTAENPPSLVKVIQSEVEEKLEKQRQDNRDIMETVTVNAVLHHSRLGRADATVIGATATE